MADEPEEEVVGEFLDPCIALSDGDCWVADPDALDPAAGCNEGVIAVQFRDGALWYMTAEARKWVNAEQKSTRKLQAVKSDKQ